MEKVKFLIILLAFVLVSVNVYAQCTTPKVFKGEGTFYGYGGGGNCSFPYPYTSMYTGALNQSQYASSALCGACAQVTGERGTITISVQDQCPECKFGDIDLDQKAFPLVADPIKGRVPISWKIVPCPVTGAVVLYFKEGSSQWWTAVQVRNHRYPIAKLEYKVNGKYVALNREAYNYFVAYSGMGPGPYSFRITDYYGRVIEETNIPLKVTTPITGKNQFPSCPAAVSTADVLALQEDVLTYPNPAVNGKVNLSNNSAVLLQYELVDAFGRVVEVSSIDAFTTITLDLPKKTTYFVRLRSESAEVHKRILNN